MSKQSPVSALLDLQQVSCGVCGSSESNEFASGKDYEYETSDNVFSMRQCNSCGNVYLNPRPNNRDLSVIYPANYYAYNYESAINPIAIAAKNFLDRAKVKQWLKHVEISEMKFLDIGCGSGRYLHMLHSLGAAKKNLHGIELSQENVQRLAEEGYSAHYGSLEQVVPQLEQNSFDLIVILQVIEHVDSPAKAMECIAGLLKPGGVLIIETPNTESLDADLFKQHYWGGYHFPRHWNLMNKSVLSSLVTSQGLMVKDTRYLPAHSFWIYSFHHLLKYKCGNEALSRFFDPFQNLVLLSIFTAFDLVRAAMGFKTSNIQMVAAKPLEP